MFSNANAAIGRHQRGVFDAGYQHLRLGEVFVRPIRTVVFENLFGTLRIVFAKFFPLLQFFYNFSTFEYSQNKAHLIHIYIKQRKRQITPPLPHFFKQKAENGKKGRVTLEN